MTVMLVDDHKLVRKGLELILAAAPDVSLVGEASDGSEALRLVDKLRPDVVVLDLAMPNMNGIEAIAPLKKTGARVVILSMYDDDAGLVRKAFRNGAMGFVVKHAAPEELLMAIRAAAIGDIFISPSIARYLIEGHERDILDQLSPREREVLQRIAEGQKNREIAEALHIGEKTVEKHRASLMRKLDVHSVADLVRIALQHRVILPQWNE